MIVTVIRTFNNFDKHRDLVLHEVFVKYDMKLFFGPAAPEGAPEDTFVGNEALRASSEAWLRTHYDLVRVERGLTTHVVFPKIGRLEN